LLHFRHFCFSELLLNWRNFWISESPREHVFDTL
jgi:hypothetical protein